MADANNQDDTKSLREAYKTLMIGDTTNQQDYDMDNDGGNVDDISDVDSVYDYDSRDDLDFDKNIFLRLKQNDLTITSTNIVLFTDKDVRCFNSIDWKEDGDCIANNTHLKKLSIILGPYCERQQLRYFFSSVHQNRSIEELEICTDHIDKEFGVFLIEGLCGHCSLVKLIIRRCENLGSIGCIALGKVLSYPKSKLKDLRLAEYELDDDGCKILCNALVGNSTLKKLRLSSNYHITSIVGLSTVLRHPNCTLTNLSLSSNGLNDEGLNVLGSALSGSSVRVLELSYNLSISSAGWRTFLNQLSHTSVHYLDLYSNKIDDSGLSTLANISTLKSLNLADIKLCTPAGWRSFFNSLQTSEIQLKKLVLSGNNIGDSGAAALGSSLSDMHTLKILKMSNMTHSYSRSINNMTSRGWVSLFTSLHGSNLDLVKFDFDSNQIDDEGMLHLLRSVSNMSSMKYLDLGHIHGVTAIGWRQALVGYLQVANANLNLVYLTANQINDEGMELLVRTLSNMSSLKSLCLGSNRLVTTVGWQALTDYLQSPNFALEQLHLCDNEYSNDTMFAFTSALSHNKTLKLLSLGGKL